MKKILLIVLILGLLLFVPKDDIVPVFKEVDVGTNQYEIVFTNRELTTKNFIEYFNNYKVISIHPYINPLYKEKATNIYKYTFDYTNISSNLNKFEQRYITFLEQKGYKQESIKIRLNGIVIEKVVLYSEEKDVLDLKVHFPKLQYKKIN